MVIFGASGDLTQRKLFPALYSLAFRHLLPRNFAVVGVARTEESDEDFSERMKAAVQEHGRDPFRDDIWETLAKEMRYISMAFDDETGWNKLAKTLADLDKNVGCADNRVYYFAVPPAAIATLVEQIGKHSSKRGWDRLVIEKPFGWDLESARELNGLLHEGLRRVGHLPHRPLPGQGDRPEHAGAAVRERDLRAGLEPPVHRPRPDHRRRVDRRSRTAPATTRRPA